MLCFFFCFLAIPRSLWDLCFLTRDQIWASYRGSRNPNHWTTREVLVDASLDLTIYQLVSLLITFLAFIPSFRFNFLLLEVLPLIDFQWDCL